MWQKGGYDVSSYTASKISIDLQHRVESLYFGVIPKSWHASSASILLDDWIRTLQQRQHMLNDWLSSGSPGWLYLHLLDDPAGLLLAMKEDYLRCYPDGVTIADLRVEARIRDPEVPELEEAAEGANGKAAAPTPLTVFATGLHLVNAMWRGGDEIKTIDKSDMLEDLTHKSRQDVSLRLFVVKKSSHVGSGRNLGGLRTAVPPGETQLSLQIPVHVWPCTPISPARVKSEKAWRLRLGRGGTRRTEESGSIAPKSSASFYVTVVMNVPAPPPPAPSAVAAGANKNDGGNNATDQASAPVPSVPPNTKFSSEWLVPQSMVPKPSSAPSSANAGPTSSNAAVGAATQQQQLNARNVQYRQVAVHSAPLWLLSEVVDK
jgi:hypothetical protein